MLIFINEESPVDIVLNILKEYNLEETDKEIDKKIDKGEKFKTTLILEKFKELFKKEIKEIDFIFFLENEIKFNKKNSSDVLKTLKEKLILKEKKTEESNKIIDNNYKEDGNKKESLFSDFLEEYKKEDRYKEKIE